MANLLYNNIEIKEKSMNIYAESKMFLIRFFV